MLTKIFVYVVMDRMTYFVFAGWSGTLLEGERILIKLLILVYSLAKFGLNWGNRKV